MEEKQTKTFFFSARIPRHWHSEHAITNLVSRARSFNEAARLGAAPRRGGETAAARPQAECCLQHDAGLSQAIAAQHYEEPMWTQC